MNKSLETPVTEKSELFIGLVGATGTDLNTIYKNIEQTLNLLNYDVYKIKISQFFYDPYFTNKYNITIDQNNTFQRIHDQMEAGNKIREESGYSSILAISAIQEVQRIREETCNKNLKNERGVAYVFQSLKHPKESKLFSDIYGFWLLPSWSLFRRREKNQISTKNKGYREIRCTKINKKGYG